MKGLTLPALQASLKNGIRPPEPAVVLVCFAFYLFVHVASLFGFLLILTWW